MGARAWIAVAALALASAGLSAVGVSAESQYVDVKITAPDAKADDEFGRSVAIWGDTLVVGAAREDDLSGAVYVYTRTVDGWALQQRLVAADSGYGSFFGIRVAIWEDTIVATESSGKPGCTSTGTVRVFTRTSAEWTERATLLPPCDGSYDSGRSVAVWDDVVAVGSWVEHDPAISAVFTYFEDDGAWSGPVQVNGTEQASYDGFGQPVAVNDLHLVVGAPWGAGPGDARGAVYVFDRSGDEWIQRNRLPAPGDGGPQRFGTSLALSGDRMVVGAPTTDGPTGATEQGAAYIFRRIGDVWYQLDRLAASDGAAGDGFGWAVAMLGDRVLIGAPFADEPVSGAGTAYYVLCADYPCTVMARLTPADVGTWEYIGEVIALGTDSYVLGAPGNDDAGENAGAVHVMLSALDPPIEVGKLSLTHHWTRVEFERGFREPLVVAGPASHEGGQPVTVRIRNVTQDGFEIRLEEWDYLDDRHVAEEVDFLAIGRGTHVLGPDTMIHAGSLITDATGEFTHVAFPTAFDDVPAVVASLASDNGSDTVAIRIGNVTTTGFDVMMQEQESRTQHHVAENIHFVAWEQGTSSLASTLGWEVGTQRWVGHKFAWAGFERTYDAAPCVIAAMNTVRGLDPATLRWTSKTAIGVKIQVDEEQSRDTETAHAKEDVVRLVFECP